MNISNDKMLLSGTAKHYLKWYDTKSFLISLCIIPYIQSDINITLCQTIKVIIALPTHFLYKSVSGKLYMYASNLICNYRLK